MDAYTRLTDSVLHKIMATPAATEVKRRTTDDNINSILLVSQARKLIEEVEQRRQLSNASSYTYIGCAVQMSPEQHIHKPSETAFTVGIQAVVSVDTLCVCAVCVCG